MAPGDFADWVAGSLRPSINSAPALADNIVTRNFVCRE
jgi:hypothetical protein